MDFTDPVQGPVEVFGKFGDESSVSLTQVVIYICNVINFTRVNITKDENDHLYRILVSEKWL